MSAAIKFFSREFFLLNLVQLYLPHNEFQDKQSCQSLCFRLYVPGDIVSDNNHISSVFIDDCINSGKLLDAKSYR